MSSGDCLKCDECEILKDLLVKAYNMNIQLELDARHNGFIFRFPDLVINTRQEISKYLNSKTKDGDKNLIVSYIKTQT